MFPSVKRKVSSLLLTGLLAGGILLAGYLALQVPGPGGWRLGELGSQGISIFQQHPKIA
jgi:hypothetical protein